MKRISFSFASLLRFLKSLSLVITIIGSTHSLCRMLKLTDDKGPPGKYYYSLYVVKSGDSISKIAKKKGVNVFEMLELNLYYAMIQNPDLIFPGQTLLIPKQKQSSKKITYGG
jgi:nucleoid-associated protein YgaU